MTDTATLDTATLDRPPIGIRLLHALGKEPDLAGMTGEDLARFAQAENRKRSSRMARLITGRRDRKSVASWQEVSLPGRKVSVRTFRPKAEATARPGQLPLVVHVHGGGFVGTAVQSDWMNSYLAANLPAVVISVEHRLLGPGVSLSDAVDDGWEVLTEVVRGSTSWGVDPQRVAVIGESTGGAVSAMSAIRARDAGLELRAQVLVNACLDVTESALRHRSVLAYPDSPTLTRAQMEFFIRLAVPSGADARLVSPSSVEDLSHVAAALVVVATVDPISDHGRRYAEQLRLAGNQVRIKEYPGATHAFLAMPGVVPQAGSAREDVLAFLRERFSLCRGG